MVRLLAAATDVPGVFGTVSPPPELGSLNNAPTGAAAIGTVLSNVIVLIYVVASIICVFMVIFSAVQWISSGGEKEAIAKARGRLTWAIIGITILALAFVFLRVLGSVLNIHFFQGQVGAPFGGCCAL